MISSVADSVKPVQLKITMGAAKLSLAAEDTTLFANDKNDRAQFRLTTTDKNLKDVARVEIKDARYADILEVIDYGNGLYAIGFKADPALVGKTVTLNLNVFLEGNDSAKANATAKIKLTIVR